MRDRLLAGVIVVWVSSSVAFGGLYLQGIDLDNARSFAHDRFYSGGDKAFIGQAYDWSGIGRGSSGGGWATMVSPSYFLSANHFHPGVGEVLTFYEGNDSSGPSHTYVVESGALVPGSGDLWLGKLTAPIPQADRISYYPIWDLGATTNYKAQMVYMYGAPNRVGRNLVTSAGSTMSLTYDVPGLGEDEAYVQVGDSGAPSMGVGNGKLALGGIHWFHSADGAPRPGDTSIDSFVPYHTSAMIANMTGETIRKTTSGANTWRCSPGAAGDWALHANWTLNAPIHQDDVVINNGGTARCASGSVNLRTLSVGPSGSGHMEILDEGVGNVTDALLIGVDSAARGSVVVGNMSTVSCPGLGQVEVGRAGAASLSLAGTSSMANRDSMIAVLPGSSGSVSISGESSWMMWGGLWVGGSATAAGGSASLNVDASDVYVGADMVVWAGGQVSMHEAEVHVDGKLDLRGSLKGCGNINGMVEIAGTLEPEGILSTGEANFLAGSRLKVGITGDEDEESINLLQVSGTADLSACTLVVRIPQKRPIANRQYPVFGAEAVAAGFGQVVFEGGIGQVGYIGSVAYVYDVAAAGDATRDGLVDDSDLSVLLTNWNKPSGWSGGDFNGDGTTDDSDLSLMLAGWTISGAAVPEPTTLLLLAVGAVVIWRRR